MKTAQNRAQEFQRRRAIGLAVVACIITAILSSTLGRKAVLSVLPIFMQLAFLVVFQVVQVFFYFGFLMYYLSGTRMEKIFPSDARSVTLDDYKGQPVVLERARYLVRILEGWGNIRDMGGEPPKGVLLIGGPGTGKTYLGQCLAGQASIPFFLIDASGLVCIAEGTAVLTSRGPIPVECIEIGDIVDTGFGVGTVEHVWNKPAEPMLEIVTREGYSIKCLSTHPLFAAMGWNKNRRRFKYQYWARAGELKEGDWVALRAGNSVWSEVGACDVDTAYYLGLLIGDGWMANFYHGRPYAVYVANDDPSIRDWVANYACKIGASPYVLERKVGIHSRQFVEKLCNLGIDPLLKAASKVIPSVIAQGTEAMACAFLRGLFDADGHTTTYGHVILSTRSAELASQVQGLLLQLGIVSSMLEGETSGFKPGLPYYRVMITGDSAEKFYTSVGFSIEHKQRGQEHLPRTRRRRHKLLNGLAWCRIRTTCERPPQRVYDLTVSPAPSYVADGFVVHNSMWMGMGAIKVRRFFSMLKKHAKRYGAAVAFVDELDAIGAARGGVEGQRGMGAGMGGMWGMGGMGTLNTLLTCMDGLEGPSGLSGWFKKKLYGWLGMPLPKPDYCVLVMGSTNRPAVLDAALTRAGRFDMQLRVTPPTTAGLREVIEYYLEDITHNPDIDTSRVASALRGSTPADVRTAIKRNAAVYAERAGRDQITEQDIYEGAWEQILGIEMPEPEPCPRDQQAIAMHEAGHAVMSVALFPELSVLLASIIPHAGTGQLGPTLGVVIPRLTEERQSLPVHFLARRVLLSMAGREAASLLGRTDMGFLGDRVNIQNAVLGLVAEAYFGYEASVLLDTAPALGGSPLAGLPVGAREGLATFLNRAAEVTREVLQENLPVLREFADLLRQEGTLTADVLEKFFEEHPVKPSQSMAWVWEKEEKDECEKSIADNSTED